MRTISLAVLAAAVAIPSLAYAQNPVGGAIGGAVVGGVVGGPVGAAVGAGIGSIAGSALPMEPSVTYGGPVVVGTVMPDTIVTYPVPRYRHYRYAVIDGEKVILDRRHRIVRVLETP
ncbi:MAG: DUF1236 domain-containing protein [Hyphomicrobiales bacterium]|nr:DUF1236 domain-containing protein [Hyphomicrobiales bacterium]